MGLSFNEPIGKNVLPPMLKNLIISSKYEQELQLMSLPGLLEQLTLNCVNDKEMNDEVLPGGLKKLTLGNDHTQKINRLPVSLETLSIHNPNYDHVFYLANMFNLKKLFVVKNYKHLDKIVKKDGLEIIIEEYDIYPDARKRFLGF